TPRPSFIPHPSSLPSLPDRLRTPDVVAVFADRAVAGELAHAGDVQDRHARPPRLVAPRPADGALALDVRVVVGQQQVVVAAVEVCSERSAAGKIRSASDTR